MKRSNLTKNISSLDAQVARYLDGELSREERLAFEARLEQDSELARALEEVTRVGDLLRETYQAEVSRVDFSDFWAEVEAGIGRLPDRADVPVVTGTKPGIWTRLSAWFGVNAWRPVAAGAVVSAAVLSILVPRHWESGHQDDFVASNDVYIQNGELIAASPDDVLSDGNGSVAASESVINTGGVEVSQVSEGASVYLVNGATIIWIADTGDAEGAAI